MAEDLVPAAAAVLPAEALRGRCDIVVPVYGGVNYVRDLLASLDRCTAYPYRVLLIDDSANEQTHRSLIDLVEDEPWIELHRNPENLGFVRTANRGFDLSEAEFICLMNTDTIVTPGWLQRMIDCARSDPRIAVVNPLSNMAVNLSVPMPPGLNLNSMAAAVAERSRRTYPDITTAVGFCMLIKRRYLLWLGGFDPIYGLGYCEESDLCMRYTEAGLRVVAADDAFVYHKGCGSFGVWLDRYAVNRRIFDARWQDAYESEYHRFLTRNPLQYMRDRLMRHSIREEEWADDVCRTVTRDSRKVHVSHLTGGSRPDATEISLRAGLAPNRTLGRVATAQRLQRAPRTPPNAAERRARLPTDPYLQRLPSRPALRITFLVGTMPIAGGTTSIVQLAREMLLAGHEVKIVTLERQLMPESFNLPCQPLAFANREELIRLFPPSDVVMATYWTTAFDYLPALRERYDFVSGYFVQDYEAWFYPPEDLEHREQVMQTYDMAEHRIVKSHWLKDMIERNHNAPCDIVHLGLDLGIFRNRKRSAELGRPPRIVSVARPEARRRGFLELVDVFRHIHSIRREVQFVFFGGPSERLGRELPFPYENHGPIDDLNQVAALIGSCDIVVDPSLFQGFGRPGIEAMACGTACVLTGEGGVAEYARHEVNCLVAKAGRTAAMADAVLRLLDDEALRTRLRMAGLETAKRYCHVDEARRHVALYRKWLWEKYGSDRAPSSFDSLRRPTAVL